MVDDTLTIDPLIPASIIFLATAWLTLTIPLELMFKVLKVKHRIVSQIIQTK